MECERPNKGSKTFEVRRRENSNAQALKPTTDITSTTTTTTTKQPQKKYFKKFNGAQYNILGLTRGKVFYERILKG